MYIDTDKFLAEATAMSKDVRIFKEIFEALFSFNKNITSDISTLNDLGGKVMQTMFFDILDRYLEVQIIPSQKALLQKTEKLNRQTSPQSNFLFVLKNIDQLYSHLINFWSELNLETAVLNQIQTKIQKKIIYDVLPKIRLESHFQIYLQCIFSNYYKSIKNEYLQTRNSSKNNDSYRVILSLFSEHESTDELSEQFIDINFVYRWFSKFYSSDEVFTIGVHNLLHNKITEFVDKIDIENRKLATFNEYLTCFSFVFIQGFVDNMTLDIKNEHTPINSTKKEVHLLSPAPLSNQKNKVSSFHKQINRVNLEVIHTEDSNISLTLQQTGHNQTFGMNLSSKKEGQEPIISCKKVRSNEFNPSSLTIPLNLFLHKTFLKKAQKYVFFAINDIDKSSHFIEDIGKSLQQSQTYTELIDDLEQQILQKLIQNSNSTFMILKFYIDLLAFWDRLRLDYANLQKLITPLKSYLISRQDSLRVIITTLMEEMNKKKTLKSQSSHYNLQQGMEIEEKLDFSDEETSEDLNFDVLGKQPEYSKFRYKKTDVKVLLADLYGSKERFFTEYESYVAEKLLYFEEVNIQDEQLNVNFLLNHLKISNEHQKFGIIVSDLNASKIWTDSFRAKTGSSYKQYDFIILSEAFWPIKKEFECFSIENFPMEKVQQEFNKHYKTSKKQSYVKFHNNLGFVEADFELNDRVLSLKTPTIAATLLFLFSIPVYFENGITLLEITQKLQFDGEYIAHSMSFWVKNEIVVEVKSTAAVQIQSEFDMDGFEQEVEIKYFINKSYFGEKTHFFYGEKDNLIIQNEADQKELNEKPIYFQLRLQRLIMNLMNGRNGSCQKDHLLDLIKSIYKNDLQTNLIDQHFEVCLQKLTKRKSLIKKGDVYYCV